MILELDALVKLAAASLLPHPSTIMPKFISSLLLDLGDKIPTIVDHERRQLNLGDNPFFNKPISNIITEAESSEGEVSERSLLSIRRRRQLAEKRKDKKRAEIEENFKTFKENLDQVNYHEKVRERVYQEICAAFDKMDHIFPLIPRMKPFPTESQSNADPLKNEEKKEEQTDKKSEEDNNPRKSRQKKKKSSGALTK
jgi:hypothetical protein